MQSGLKRSQHGQGRESVRFPRIMRATVVNPLRRWTIAGDPIGIERAIHRIQQSPRDTRRLRLDLAKTTASQPRERRLQMPDLREEFLPRRDRGRRLIRRLIDRVFPGGTPRPRRRRAGQRIEHPGGIERRLGGKIVPHRMTKASAIAKRSVEPTGGRLRDVVFKRRTSRQRRQTPPPHIRLHRRQNRLAQLDAQMPAMRQRPVGHQRPRGMRKRLAVVTHR